MPSNDDVQFALETTSVLRSPDRMIDTFGTTQFEFHLISELMDSVGQIRIRHGKIEAERPRILRPEYMAEFDFEGFGPQAQAFGNWLARNAPDVAFLKYGFQFRRQDISEHIVHEKIEEVCGRVVADVESSGNPLAAVIHGVDDTWEICLLKFTVEMIARSQGVNVFDFRRRGLL